MKKIFILLAFMLLSNDLFAQQTLLDAFHDSALEKAIGMGSGDGTIFAADTCDVVVGVGSGAYSNGYVGPSGASFTISKGEGSTEEESRSWSLQYTINGQLRSFAGNTNGSFSTPTLNSAFTLSYDLNLYSTYSYGTYSLCHSYSLSIQLDNTAPSIGCTPQAYNNAASVTVPISTSESQSGLASLAYRHKIGSGSYSSWTSTTAASTNAVFTAEGLYTLQVKATDKVGNERTTDYTFRIDRTLPTIALAGPDYVNPSSPPGDRLETITASDSLSALQSGYPRYRWSLNNGVSWISWQVGSSIVIPSSDGLYLIEAEAVDNAGNRAVASKQVWADSIAPTVQIEVPAFSNAASVWVGLMAEDRSSDIASGYPQYRYAGQDGLFSAWTTGTSFTLDIADAYSIQARAVDRAGNSRQVQRNLIIDRTPPTIAGFTTDAWTSGLVAFSNIQLSDPLIGGVAAGISDISWTATPLGGQEGDRQVLPEEAVFENGVLSFAVQLAEAGTTTYTLYVRDQAGNLAVATHVVTLDTSPPSIQQFIAPAWTTGAVSFSGIVVSDPPGGNNAAGVELAGLSYSVSPLGQAETTPQAMPAEAVFASGRLAFSLDLAGQGAAVIRLHVRDRAGNEAVAETTTQVDAGAPEFQLSATGLARLQAGLYQVSASITDISELPGQVADQAGVAPDGWFWAVDTGNFIPINVVYSNAGFSRELSLSDNLAEGTHQLHFYCKDGAGRQSATQSVSFILDKTPPSLVLPAAAARQEDLAGWTPQTTHLASATDDNGLASLTYRLERKSGQVWIDPLSGPVAGTGIVFPGEGVYRLTLTAVDQAGNQADATCFLRLDNSPPAISLVAGNNSFYRTVPAQAQDDQSGVEPGSWQWRSAAGTWENGQVASGLADGNAVVVEFTVRDQVGNQGSASFTVPIDTTGPVLTYNLTEFIQPAGFLTISQIDASDNTLAGIAGSGVDRIQYRIDDGPLQALADWPVLDSRAVPIGNLAPGLHRLTLQALDAVGNPGSPNVQTFTVDNQAPVLTSLELTQAGLPVGEHDVLTTAAFSVALAATDQAGSDPAAGLGQVAGWFCQVRGDLLPESNGLAALPESASFSAVSPLTLGGLTSGQNYLYVWVKDVAGNVSSFRRLLEADGLAPRSPTVSSSTHRRWTNQPGDAVPFNNASFRIQPNETGATGLRGYQWSLYCSNGNQPLYTGKIDSAGLAWQTFENLADNQPNEYYRFSVQAIGQNGLASASFDYLFRIDSTPPIGLRLYAMPQADVAAWHAEPQATISWQQPADMTGVAAYYYRVGLNGPIAIPAANQLPDTNWKICFNRRLDLALASMLADVGRATGTFHVQVLALDYAGNIAAAILPINVDFAAPRFASLDSTTSLWITPETATASANLTWGRLEDQGSDMDSLDILVQAVSGAAFGNFANRHYFLDQSQDENQPPPPTSLVLSNLAVDTVYGVILTATDTAGNSTVLRGSFALGTVDMPAELRYPYRQDHGAISLEATRLEGNGPVRYEFARLNLPAGLELSRLDLAADGSQVWTSLTSLAAGNQPEDLTIAEDGSIASLRTSLAADPVYAFTLNGFSFRASGFSFSAQTGLAAQGVVLERQALGVGTEASTLLTQAITIGPLAIGDAPGFSLAGTSQESVNCFTARAAADLPPSGLYAISPASGLRLDGNSERLTFTDASSVTFDASWFAAAGIDLVVGPVVDENASRLIPLVLPRFLAGGVEPEASLPAGEAPALTLLRMSDTTYQLRQASLRGPELVVYEAWLNLPGNTSNPVVLRNFIIDGRTGRVRTIAGQFSCTSFTVIGPQGQTVVLDNFSFSPSGQLIGHGQASAGQSHWNINNLVITDAGPDWNIGATINEPFYATVHGFLISSTSASLKANGMLLASASLTYAGADRTVSQLGLASDDGGLSFSQVWQDGQGSESFLIDLPYGDELSLRQLRVSASGVSAELTLPVAAGLFPDYTSGQLVFPAAQLDANGGIAASLTNVRLRLAGFTGVAGTLSFDGSALAVANLQLDLPAGFYDEADQPLLHLEGLEGGRLGAAGWTAGFSLTKAVEYRFADWVVYFDTIGLDINGQADDGQTVDGLGGAAFLAVPLASGASYVSFPQFRVLANGSVNSGLAATDASLPLAGWPVQLDTACLAPVNGGYELTAASSSIQATHIEMPILVIGALRIGANGQLLAVPSNVIDKGFLSFNGYQVQATSIAIDHDQLLLGGRLRPDWWPANQAISFPAGKLRLLADASVIALQTVPAATYQFAGWTIAATDIDFAQRRITVGGNTVTHRGKAIPLGNLVYATEGYLLRGAFSQERSQMDIFGSQFELIETRFDENGLVSRAFLTLPPSLGGYSILFDRIGLFPDGSFTVETTVPRFAFNVGGFDFDFEDIWLGEAGLRVGKATITLPKEANYTQIRLAGLTVLSDGRLELTNASVDPFQLWNMWFGINQISIANNVVSFQGFVGLPNNPELGALAGRRVAIKEFLISTAGVIQKFDVRLEGDYVFPITEGVSLRVSNFGVVYRDKSPRLVLQQGTLIFPPEFFIDNAIINMVEFNLATCQFNFSSLQANLQNCVLEKWGMRFELSMVELIMAAPLDDTDPLQISGFGLAGRVILPTDPEKVPACLAGAIIQFGYDPDDPDSGDFRIGLDGKLQAFSMNMTGLSGSLAPATDWLTLDNGSLGIKKVEGTDDISLSIGGRLQFTPAAPAELRGASITLTSFVFDFETLSLVKLEAAAAGLSPQLFGLRTQGVGIKVTWTGNPADRRISLTGSILLPSNMPAGLANQPATIKELTFFLDGVTPPVFEANFYSDAGVAYDAIGQIQFCNSSLVASLKQGVLDISMATQLILPYADFPLDTSEKTDLVCDASMRFNTSTGLDYISASIWVPDTVLFERLPFNQGQISFKLEPGQPLRIGLAGQLLLPADFPSGLAGLPINASIVFDTNGAIHDLDVAATDIKVDIFDGNASIFAGSVNLYKGTAYNEVIVAIAGKLCLKSPDLPQSVRDAYFVINILEVSTMLGLTDFSAGIVANSPVTFPLMAGVTASIESLQLDMAGFSIEASAILDNTFPVGLAGASFSLSPCSIAWNGTIRALAGGLESTSFDLFGFQVSISHLFLTPTGVTLESCSVTMPSNFGSMAGRQVGIKDAGFDSVTGDFYGEFVIPVLEAEFAGFRLALHKPDFDQSISTISFEKAILTMPALVGGGTLELAGVSLGGAGLSISGGSFRIPDFSLAGGLGFSNIQAVFTIYPTPTADGERYTIGGGATMTIPGAGAFTAEITFSNKSAVYPIGLKRAFFSYYASTPGIVLGATGLALNGIRGGIAFGPVQPGEMPDQLKPYFRNGMRLQLGLRLVDVATIGKVTQADGDVWVDVADWTWAFNVDMTILKGTLDLTANVQAVLSTRGFYAGLHIGLRCVRGELELRIFSPDKKRTLLAGRGLLQFGLPRGGLISSDFWNVYIPDQDLWLPGLQAEFGDFTNGERGFKGFVTLPVVNQVGVFVNQSGVLDFDVNDLVLVTPSRAAASAAPIGQTAATVTRLGLDQAGLQVADRRFLAAPALDAYQFFVPANPSGLPANPLSLVGSSSRRPTAASATELLASRASGNRDPATNAVPAYERIIFLLSYAEGDPELVITAPSGRQYRPGDAAVETQYLPNAIFFAITDMEVGEWRASVSGVPEGSYRLQGLTKESLPRLILTEPAYADTQVQGLIDISGTVDRADGIVKIFACPADSELGQEIGRLAIQPDGSFSGRLDSSLLEDGGYRLYACLEAAPDVAEMRVAAPGSILVDRSGLGLAPPGPFYAAETAPGTVSLRWEDPNGALSSGYFLITENHTWGGRTRQYLGWMDELVVPGFLPGDEVSFSLLAVDTRHNESLPCAPVRLRMAAPAPTVNQPVPLHSQLAVSAEIGGVVSGNLEYTLGNYAASADASRFIMARPLALPALPANPDEAAAPVTEDAVRRLSLRFSEMVAEQAGAASLAWTLALPDDLAPGTYTVPCELFNMANASGAVAFDLVLTATCPPVSLDSVWPDSWHNRADQVLELRGSGFLPGTRVFLDDREMAPAAEGRSSGSLKLTAPAGLAGGQHWLRVVGADGQEASLAVQVRAPDWQASLHAAYVEVQAGDRADFMLSILPLEGFDSSVTFTVSGLPAFWLASLPPVAAGQTGYLSIQTAPDSPAGSYLLQLEAPGSRSLTMEVRVSDTPVGPVLTSLEKASAYPGETVSLYGYGFGASGSLNLGGLDCPVLAWSASAVRFQVPDAAVSGALVLTRDGLASNSLAFSVSQRGFSLRLESAELAVQAGDTVALTLAVSGYADSVSLSLAADAALGSDLAVNPLNLVPNGQARLNLRLPIDLAAGSYEIRIAGQSRGFLASATLRLVIGAGFDFITAALPRAMQDSAYRVALATEHGQAPVSFSIMSGALPPGLSLSAEGVIQGRPAEAGAYECRIVATDQAGRHVSHDFKLAVDGSGWTTMHRDAGNSRYSASPAPADGRIAWSANLGAPAQGLINGGNRLWVRLGGDTPGLAAYSRQGALEYRLEGAVSWLAYAGGTLYTLEPGAGLVARAPESGLERWRRDDALDVATEGSVLLVRTATTGLLLSAHDGSLLAEGLALPPNLADTVWLGDSGLFWQGDQLRRLTDGSLFFQADGPILAVAADSAGLAVLAETDTLYSLDASGLIRASCALPAAGPEALPAAWSMALDAETILISDGWRSLACDRADGRLLWQSAAGGVLAAAPDKLYLAGPNGLLALNRYTGQPIWQAEGQAGQLLLSGERLYGADTAGRLRCFDGPDNAAQPVTSLALEPAAPDGNHGWYRSAPLVTVTSQDRDGFISLIEERQDAGAWQAYAGPRRLTDGRFRLEAAALDNKGWRGQPVSLMVNVDTQPPLSHAVLEGLPGQAGWYAGPVRLSLAGEDALSGLAYLEIEGLGVYQAPLTLGAGVHELRFRAVDQAGNAEDWQALTVQVDDQAPLPSHSLWAEWGIVVVTLAATDAQADAVRLEYRLDGGSSQTYDGQFAIITPGWHEVSYRAIDPAGNASPWAAFSCQVRPWHFPAGYAAFGRVLDAPLSFLRPVTPHRLGNQSWPRGPGQTAWQLPRELWGGDALLPAAASRGTPGQPYATFWTKHSALVYVYTMDELPGWTLLDAAAAVNEARFPGGARLYARRFEAGQLVTIPGDAAVTAAPVIVVNAQAKPHIQIQSPHPGRVYAPLEAVHLRQASSHGGGDGLLGGRVEWSIRPAPASRHVQLDDEALWEPIQPDGFQAPWTETAARWEIRVRLLAFDGAVVALDRSILQVENQAEFRLQQPTTNRPLRAGDRVRLSYRARDAAGQSVDTISWLISRDGAAWQPADVTDNTWWRVPAGSGPVYLKAVYVIAPGRTWESVWMWGGR